MDNTCICCGAVIPEGRQVCPSCEAMTTIASCPFCGSTKLKVESKHHGMHYYEGTHSATVRCKKCHARGPTASCKVERGKYHADNYTKQRAIELWNERVS